MSSLDAEASARAASDGFAPLLLLTLLIGALLRFRGLDTDSLWLDEFATFAQTRAGLGDVFVRTAADNYPPAENILVWLSIHAFGVHEWSLRLPSAIAGLVNVWAAYWVASLLGGRVAGLVAALGVAVSSYLVVYSQEARMYALLACATTLYVGTILRMMVAPNPARALWSVLAGALLLYSHPYGAFAWAFIAASAAVLLLLYRRDGLCSLGKFILLQIATFLLFVPWAWILLTRVQVVSEGFWIGRPTLDGVVTMLRVLASGYYGVAFLVLGWLLAIFWRPAPSVFDRKPKVPLRIGVPILVAAIVGPFLAGLSISLVATPILVPRYLIGTVPPGVILASLGYANLVTSWRRLSIVLAAVGSVLSLTFIGANVIHNEEWRELASYLRPVLKIQDCLFFSAGYISQDLDFYGAKLPECHGDYEDIGQYTIPIGDAPTIYIVRAHSAHSADELRDGLPISGQWSELRRQFGYAITLITLTKISD